MVNNWIEWNGGECPVPKGTLVDLRYRSKYYEDSTGVPALVFGNRSEEDFWQHDSWGLDIIAWRLHQPEQQAWDGDGLPPVGTECEVNRAGDWMCCRIEFISGMHVVMKMAGSEVCWQTCACTFRPLRTEAERKREDLKSAIAEICRQSASNGHSADLIYDAIAAGKIPGVKLED